MLQHHIMNDIIHDYSCFDITLHEETTLGRFLRLLNITFLVIFIIYKGKYCDSITLEKHSCQKTPP